MINIWIIIGICILLVIILMVALNYYANKIHNETLRNINKFFDGIKSFLFIGLGERISTALEDTETHEEDEDNTENTDNTRTHDGTF